ncbi:MAG: isopentenyl-diphosphate Delta-isomerase [Pseudonocardiales bacterium]|nr:isopentenyl-diphosphate Delta-isomerase [Pseudonocardiales bacterium]
MELVVLVDDDGRPVGTADKVAVHGAQTPRHLAFSCYGFDESGRLLVTRRAADKITFPGVRTNTCCGHPAPGERPQDAVRRRLRDELGVDVTDLRLVLPDFAYRASAGGIEENELCPVFTGTVVGTPHPRPDEVESCEWWTWDRFLDVAADPDSDMSPWARLQAPLLAGLLRDGRFRDGSEPDAPSRPRAAGSHPMGPRRT